MNMPSEQDLKDAGEFIKIIAGFGTMISTYIAIRRAQKEHKQELTREEIRKILASGEVQADSTDVSASSPTTASAVPALTVAMVIIDHKILDATKKRITVAKDRFAKAIGDIRYTPGQLDQETQIAKAEICATLQLIKDHNNDELPDGDLKQIWDQFKCGNSI